jgi:hypothetical protein
VAGSFLIIDLSQTPPSIVAAEDVLPAAILEKLTAIDDKLEAIRVSMASEQATIDNMAAGIQAVADHVSAATATLGQWIADHPDVPPADLAHLQTAFDSLTAADGGLQGIVPQVPPDAPLDTPVADPGPAPDVPPDTTVPPPDVAPPDASGIDTGAPPPDAGSEVNPL